MHVDVTAVTAMVTLMTYVQAVNPAKKQGCTSWYFLSKDCPDWHFCHGSESECLPCQVCSSQQRSVDSSGNCKPPVSCTSGTHYITCPRLYVAGYPNTSIEYSSDRPYLGTEVTTSCAVNETQYTASLMCGVTPELVPVWNGDMTCVTLTNTTTPGTLDVKREPQPDDPIKYIVLVITVIVCSLGLTATITFSIYCTRKHKRRPPQSIPEQRQANPLLVQGSEEIIELIELAIRPGAGDAVEHSVDYASSMSMSQPGREPTRDPREDRETNRARCSLNLSFPVQESVIDIPKNSEQDTKIKIIDENNEQTSPKQIEADQLEDIGIDGVEHSSLCESSPEPTEHSLFELSLYTSYTSEKCEPYSSLSLTDPSAPSTSMTSDTKQLESNNPFRHETAAKIRLRDERQLPTENSCGTSISSEQSPRHSILALTSGTSSDNHIICHHHPTEQRDTSNICSQSFTSSEGDLYRLCRMEQPCEIVITSPDNEALNTSQRDLVLRGPDSDHLFRSSSGCYGASSSSQSENGYYPKKEVQESGDSGITPGHVSGAVIGEGRAAEEHECCSSDMDSE